MGSRRTKGEGSIYQRQDGRWVGTLDFGWIGGQRRRRSVTAPTLKELRPKFNQLKKDAEAGLLLDDTTVTAWLTYWLEHIAAKEVRPRTLDTYRTYVATWLVPHVGGVRLSKLRTTHVVALLAEMEAAGKSVATRRQAHAILRRALLVAVRHGKLSYNPADNDHMQPPKIGTGSHGSLNLEEARAVLRVLDAGHPRAARWGAALLAGIRQGEALGLHWEDVDLGNGLLYVTRTIQRVKGQGLVEGAPKSRSSVRAVPLLPALVAALQAQGPGEGYVWGNAPDIPMDPRQDYQEWRDLLHTAGVRHVPLHAARATCASLLMAAGVPDKVTAEILGHSQVQITQRHYLHGDVSQRRQAVERLADLLGNGPVAIAQPEPKEQP